MLSAGIDLSLGCQHIGTLGLKLIVICLLVRADKSAPGWHICHSFAEVSLIKHSALRSLLLTEHLRLEDIFCHSGPLTV
jgi:hypothetical protein